MPTCDISARSRSLGKKATRKYYVGTFFLAYILWDVTYMLACLESGSRAWPGGRHNPSQVISIILILSACSSLKRTETGGPGRALNPSR